MTPKNKIIIVSVIIIASALAVYLWQTSPAFKKAVTFYEKPHVVEETLVVPETMNVDLAAGRTPSTDRYAVPIAPATEGDKVVVPNAVLTLKGSYDIAKPKAEEWSLDAKLVLIVSKGSVTLDGKSSMWQVVFGSLSKKKGYEVVVQGDKIVSEKEVPTDEYGYNLPTNWYDAGEAIGSIQSLPQFAKATVSSINFFYNRDAKRWGYALGTSLGTTSMPVK